MPTPGKKLALLGTFFLLIGCKAVTPTTALPTLLPTPIPAPVTQTTSTVEVIAGYGFPYVSASLYGDAGNFEIQAGILAQVTWTDAPPAADYYEFTLRLHTDKSILLIGTDTDDTDGISVDWLIPEHTSGELRASAYFADGREVHSAAIDVYSYKAVPEGACVLRSHTIVPISVYQSPSDTAEIIGVMYPAAIVETVGKNSNGWYKIKTDDVNAAGAFEQKIGPGTAWLYESFTEFFGACENLSVLETESPGACTDPTLGISYQVPANWDTRWNKPGDFSTSMTSFDLTAPPHKLLWDETTVQIDIRRLDTVPASVDEWVEATKDFYHIDGTSMWIYKHETHTLENGQTLEHLTLVSGSGGVLHLIYFPIEENHLEFQVQGNFELAVPVFNSMQACAP